MFYKLLFAAALTVPAAVAFAQLPGEGPRLGSDRITQAEIESGELTLQDIRRAGMIVFTTPFNKADGYGDGPMNPMNTTEPGGRPTLQNNGTFLRINGLDGQTCLECHADTERAPPSNPDRPQVHNPAGGFFVEDHDMWSCTDCHDYITEIPHPEEVTEKEVDCTNCHDEAPTK